MQALQFVTSLVKSGSMSQSVVTWAQSDVNEQFMAGKAAMMINGPWQFPVLDAAGRAEVRSGPHPGAHGREAAKVPLGGEVWTVPVTNSAREEAAAKVLACMNSSANQLAYAKANGYIPSLESAAKQIAAQSPQLAPFVTEVDRAVAHGRGRDRLPEDPDRDRDRAGGRRSPASRLPQAAMSSGAGARAIAVRPEAEAHGDHRTVAGHQVGRRPRPRSCRGHPAGRGPGGAWRPAGTGSPTGAFLAPALLYLAAFFAYPVVRNVLISFQDYSITSLYTGQAPFAGLANYRAIFDSGLLRGIVVNTAIFTVGSMAGQFVIGLGLALFFSRRFPLNGVIRALLLLPWLLPMVASTTVWRWLLDQDSGALNRTLPRAHHLGHHPVAGVPGTSRWSPSSSSTSGSGSPSTWSSSTAG